MSEERRHEKQDEKRDDEKGAEKWARDPVGAAVWALILIWAGVAFLLVNAAGEGGVTILSMDIDDTNVWALIMAGAGVLIWLGVLVRVVMPAHRRPLGGSIILGTIFLIVGGGELIPDEDVELWPLIIIAVGVSMLFGFFRPRRT